MNKSNIIIAPSILAANFAHLQQEVASVEEAADWLQVDVMDGHFVPNLSFGAPVMKCIETDLLLDVHLMVSNPADRIDEFIAAGAKHISFHAEAVRSHDDRMALVDRIHSAGATAGIALNPDTPLSDVEGILGHVDMLLIMSVHPGFGGQSFIDDVLEKVKEARKKFPSLMIQMDGGIDDKTIGKCFGAGADNFVSGSYIFKANNRSEAISLLRSHCSK